MINMKCPFCQQELEINDLDVQLLGCENQNCKHSTYYDNVGSKELWQELIRTRKTLNVAVDALEMIDSGKILEHSVFGHENETKTKIAHSALEKITALEQKDVK